ncbi:cytochrome d ubiquinol oxidase subunit II [Actinomadura madurae]|nr:cytochrome d ubiquinol oxidase subunit II [Actinomadura madurae]
MLLPWLGRDQRERRLVIASFAPFFLGNEVWLVAAAGLVGVRSRGWSTGCWRSCSRCSWCC